MKHGSLFSGIGGFDLAAEWMGWENVFHCEWNEFGKKILKHYWPNAISYHDITKTDFTIHRGKIDILTGGFPCQPYSSAGKRKGTADSRHLWPEMLRAIREIQPSYVVGENVRGITNWNRGMVFDQVQADLENEGYQVLPFLLPACGVNAPHRRDRIWFVAYTSRDGYQWRGFGESRSAQKAGPGIKEEWKRFWNDTKRTGEKGFVADTTSLGSSGSRRPINIISSKENKYWKASWAYNDGRWPTQPPVRGRDDGVPSKLDDITISDWSIESLKGFGNAIVPQVALELFKGIEMIYNDWNSNPLTDK